MAGVQIEVNEECFMQKTEKEQNFVLLQAVMHLDNYGCRFERKRYKVLYPIIVVGSVVGGFFASVFQKLGIKLF